MPVAAHTSTVIHKWIVRLLRICKQAPWQLPISLPNFFSFAAKESTSSFWCDSFPVNSHCAFFLGCRNPQAFAELSFFLALNYFSMQQKEEAVQVALIQMASEKQAAQLRPLLKRNVEGVNWRAVCGGCKLPETGDYTLPVAEDTMRDCNFRSLPRCFSHHFIFAASGAAESSGSRALISFTPQG